MKVVNVFGCSVIAAAVALSLGGRALAQETITEWNFAATNTANVPNPAPSMGSGTLGSLGMTNNYLYSTAGTNTYVLPGTAGGPNIVNNPGTISGTGATAFTDINSSTGVANPSFTENTWRDRGTKQGGNAGSANNGWNLAAPEYTQGLEFDVPTTGFQGINVSFDWYSTTQGIRDMQPQYNLNVSNSAGWTNIGPQLIAVSNDFYGTSTPTNTLDLSSISGANNDPEFGIRLVSAYDQDPTFVASQEALSGATASYAYASAALNSGGLVQIYNNNSGNWRFDNIAVSGTPLATPEPSTLALLAVGGIVGVVGLARRRRRG